MGRIYRSTEIVRESREAYLEPQCPRGNMSSNLIRVTKKQIFFTTQNNCVLVWKSLFRNKKQTFIEIKTRIKQVKFELLRKHFPMYTLTPLPFYFIIIIGAVAQRLEQVVLKLSIKGQSKFTSYTFNVRVVGSNPTCSTINGQLKLTSDNWLLRFESGKF